MSDKIIKCIICKDNIEHKTDPQGVVYWTEGNNALPVADGRCCDSCDCRVVIPSRMGINPHSKQGKAMGNHFYETRMNPPIFDEQPSEPIPCTAFRKGDDPRYECQCAECIAKLDALYEGDES